MKARNLTILLFSALLLPSCSNPYFSMSGGSEIMIENDLRFLERYKDTFCGIRDMHEQEEISRGRCLALYYESNEDDTIQNNKKEVGKRISYILNNPGKFDDDLPRRLSETTTEIGSCISYIRKYCM